MKGSTSDDQGPLPTTRADMPDADSTRTVIQRILRRIGKLAAASSISEWSFSELSGFHRALGRAISVLKAQARANHDRSRAPTVKVDGEKEVAQTKVTSDETARDLKVQRSDAMTRNTGRKKKS